MRDHRRLSDQDLDRLLAGKAPSGGDEVDQALAALTRELRTGVRPVPASLERSVVAAAVEASRLTVDKGNPVARPASKAHGPDRQASGLPKWRRRTVFSSLFASLTAKIAGVAIAAAAATGGLAATGTLPAPAQQAVSQAASTIGIHLPSPHGPAATPQAAHSPTPGESVTATAHDAQDGVTDTASAGVNHGNCVSYAAAVADKLGMTGSLKGQFIAAVAQDTSAVSARVTGTATPDSACQVAITTAEAAATSPGKSGTSHGAPSVTGTAGAGSNPTGFGPTNHPTATDHPTAGNHPTNEPGSTPPSSSGSANNPTGFGPTNHPGAQ